MSGLPKHSIKQDPTHRSVYRLTDSEGVCVASYATKTMGHQGGVFTVTGGRGWTRDMAERAFKDHFNGRTP